MERESERERERERVTFVMKHFIEFFNHVLRSRVFVHKTVEHCYWKLRDKQNSLLALPL